MSGIGNRRAGRADVAIVGEGSASCALVSRPSGDPTRSVVASHGKALGGRSRLRLAARRWPGLVAFAAAYLLYEVSRWIFAGRLPVAQLVVLPGALIWLYRGSPRSTVSCATRSSRPG
jgi:hypothetical protein